MAWWIWVLAGLALFAFELLTPGGFFVIFFGVGALAVGLLAGLGIVEAGPVEWLLFSAISVVSLLLFRKPLLEWMKRREPARPPVDSLVGETAVLTEDLPAGGVGKAELRGTSWNVRAREEAGLARGQRTKVERVDGLTLWVRAEQ
ncbi:MAG TPA: NfeD family protein [Candidatus Polarisedimenticolia bacterium]|nr:NfeD family protein [Candidatus Polarisedimenticolia bacterium]